MVTQFRQNVKVYATVTPMKAVGIKQRRTRPQPIVCRGCQGTRRLEWTDQDTGKVKSMPCIFCAETGVQFRNADHVEHRNLLQRLAGWSLSAIKAVLL